MKRISLVNIRKDLSKNEMKKIIAGSQDVNNINGTFSCLCTYNNNSVTQNTNSAGGCRCDCD